MTDLIRANFADRMKWDAASKTAVSVRDGVLEYLGAEIGMQPAEKVFTVYRSPATIANTAAKMAGIPLTDEHVQVGGVVSASIGEVVDGEMVDLMDKDTNSRLGVRNRIKATDELTATLSTGKRELSLGYNAALVPYEGDEGYDFEQRDIQPHHLAVVKDGRCGASCSFLDKKSRGDSFTLKTEDNPMDLTIFKDQEGGEVSLKKVMEIAKALPDALGDFDLEQMQELKPIIQQLSEMLNLAPVAEQPAEQEVDEGEEMEVEDMDKDKDEDFEDSKAFKDAVDAAVKDAKGFSDADLKKFADEAIQKHAEVIDKARQFVDETYDFSGKSTAQVQRDALAVEHGSQKFSDEELDMAFKLLKKSEQYKNFGDGADNTFDSIKDKEL